MPLRVEFYGIARQRAGVGQLELDLPAGGETLAGVLSLLGQRLPAFGRECLRDGRLHPTLAANLGGQRFINEPATAIHAEDSLLILSADAGG
jgi:molybdopterin converting factor small subunit